MENLIRIKLDSRRGGQDTIDFRRPCFRLGEWPSSSLRIAWSQNGGQSWQKLPEEDYTIGYDGDSRELYVSLKFDVTGVTLFAFFAPEGTNCPIGYSLAKWNRIGIGWDTEGVSVRPVPIGWVTGDLDGGMVGSGFTIEGVWSRNNPLGFTERYPTLDSTPLGASIAEPVDSPVGLGFDIGTVLARTIGAAGTVLGLAEYPLAVLVLDPTTKSALCAEAAHRKQKMVTLYGTTPEELD